MSFSNSCHLTFSLFFFLMIRRPPRSTLSSSSAASDVYKRQRYAVYFRVSHAHIQRSDHLGSPLMEFNCRPATVSVTAVTLHRGWLSSSMIKSTVTDAIVSYSYAHEFSSPLPEAMVLNWKTAGWAVVVPLMKALAIRTESSLLVLAASTLVRPDFGDVFANFLQAAEQRVLVALEVDTLVHELPLQLLQGATVVILCESPSISFHLPEIFLGVMAREPREALWNHLIRWYSGVPSPNKAAELVQAYPNDTLNEMEARAARESDYPRDQLLVSSTYFYVQPCRIHRYLL
eukprot:TRINITY_DN14069_c0_g1_i1.p1 TRINITY_DN14069_c0_g1~~TRINITY_DN14069_c0_g1_i1.p1  ORF type:complete len:289 (-),score=38.90 TRINITY_DN14069_c0_g1_i1:720-1586(-)